MHLLTGARGIGRHAASAFIRYYGALTTNRRLGQNAAPPICADGRWRMSVPRILILFLMLVVAVTHGVKPTFAGVVFLAKSGAPSCSGVIGILDPPHNINPTAAIDKNSARFSFGNRSIAAELEFLCASRANLHAGYMATYFLCVRAFHRQRSICPENLAVGLDNVRWAIPVVCDKVMPFNYMIMTKNCWWFVTYRGWVNGYIADPQTRPMARYKFSAHAVYHTSCHPPQGTGERCHDYTRQSRDDIVVNVNGVCNACAIQAPSDEELDDKERLFVKGLIFLILLAVTCAIGKRIR